MLKKLKPNKKIAIVSLVAISAIFLFLNLKPIYAAVDVFGGQQATIQDNLGLSSQNPMITAAKVVRIALGFLGLIAVILVLYGGWTWMTSGGAPDKIEKARKTLINAAIGLLIILSAFGLVTFILNSLLGATGLNGLGGGGGPGGSAGGLNSLGNGIVQSHYPKRDATGIARNTNIVITFKEPMDPTTLITAGKISNNILIYKTAGGSAPANLVTNVSATSTADKKTFLFNPDDYLGSPSEEIYYTVALTGGIKKVGGASVPAISNIAYSWSFQVSTIVDVTPPQVESIVPFAASTEPRNVVIQINFNEAVNPIAASGATTLGFNNVVVTNLTDATPVAGNFYISNEYKTVEFLTEDACGVNSCGNKIYCLPGNKNLEALVKADTLLTVGQPTGAYPYNGIVDMCDNSLDGNKDGVAQGPTAQSGKPAYNENAPDVTTQADSYRWAFNTTNVIDITAPSIVGITPNISASNVSLSADISATFNKLLMSSSLDGGAVLKSAVTSTVNYSTSKTDNFLLKQTRAQINHDQFLETANYKPNFQSGIKDIYQNCFKPSSGVNAVGAPVNGTPSVCNGLPSAGLTCP